MSSLNEDIVILITQKNAKQSHCVVERNFDLKSEALRISFFRDSNLAPMVCFGQNFYKIGIVRNP